VPYVGQKRTVKTSEVAQPAVHELPGSEVSPHLPVHRPAPASNGSNETIVGFRAAQGLGRIMKAATRAPGIVTVAMAQGAHNIPRMWGDKTVRPQDKVTGVVSGVAAGCKVGFRCELLVWLDCDILIEAALFADIASSLDVGTCPWYV
jgi:hypothetical protein